MLRICWSCNKSSWPARREYLGSLSHEYIPNANILCTFPTWHRPCTISSVV
ncbi:hypothetical protein RchiOBHm_Chr1g0350091 [Rosa chinensis]|uniref:Uncharacterized protein n=1 Tax=Rosa chinensis TaxID=74649 RepID=A0A2P6SFZ3_ROSCH|nr:hypothetical protein RchiOBHm_Chr1g0350091 [Rosa chinensis]